MKVLFITTSHDTLTDTSKRTGVWLEEIAVPYYLFKEAGAEISLASPLGGEVPLDPKSQSIIVATPATKRFMKDEAAMNFLETSILLDEVIALDYDIAFVTGGHGAIWDFIDNPILKQVLETFHNEHKPIGLLSQGVIALAAMQNEAGDFLVKGKQLTAISNTEEDLRGVTKMIPFLVETELKERGALYNKGTEYMSNVIIDGNIVTGQNSASAAELTKKLLTLVDDKKYKPVTQSPDVLVVS